MVAVTGGVASSARIRNRSIGRIARVLRAGGSNLLIENQRALPVFWKRP